MIDAQVVKKLVFSLMNDLRKLKTDKSYLYNEPMYFNYAIYWDSLCNKLEELDTVNTNFGSLLLWSASAEVVNNKKELWQVVESLISKLNKKLKELEYDTCKKS